ncbi:hypothetical protein NPIL_476801 [Nephila pilipes]|uniref:Uncharacterized protein n=1 Tax=Nephila pilipes TaxID=299642 RepID=A0A8X6P537_NEPPI|nr:hypothetical protein NPIL_476801 [Nephila pilipes]
MFCRMSSYTILNQSIGDRWWLRGIQLPGWWLTTLPVTVTTAGVEAFRFSASWTATLEISVKLEVYSLRMDDDMFLYG